MNLFFDPLSRQAISVPGALHDRTVRRGLATHEERNADRPSLPTTAISADAPSLST